jgi:uncharacterized protein YpmB
MNKTTKILLIAFLILITAVSVSLCYLITNSNKNTSTNVSNHTNNTTTQINYTQTTKTKKTTKSSNSGLISARKAISIVKHSAPSVNCTFSAKLITSSNPPYYLVNVYDNNPQHSSYGWAIGGAKVNAKTGKIIFAMG